MSNQIYDEMSLESEIKSKFGLDVTTKSLIAHEISVAPAARATVFLSQKGLLFAYIHGSQRLALADIKKILARMGLKPELFLPPRGEAHYFDEIGARKFREIFPGRKVVSDKDLLFYRTLAPYNPAFVQIAEVTDGVIKQYDADSVGNWRPATQFSYRRIRTS